VGGFNVDVDELDAFAIHPQQILGKRYGVLGFFFDRLLGGANGAHAGDGGHTGETFLLFCQFDLDAP